MRKSVLIIGVLALLATPFITVAQDQPEAPSEQLPTSNQILHPEWYLKVVRWSFFVPARVAMLSHVQIVNTADIAYKDIKIRASYTSYSGVAPGQTIATNVGTLPVTVPPKSHDVYIKSGMPFGAGSWDYRISNIEVLDATPIKD